MLRRLYELCIPARGAAVPIGADWIHEIKHDGYRMIVHRHDKVLGLFTRNHHDWNDLGLDGPFSQHREHIYRAGQSRN